MPTKIDYLRCDVNDCDGVVEKIAGTDPLPGNRADEEWEDSVFYECKKCGQIFLRQTRGCDLRPYEGQLTREIIIAEVPKHKGIFSYPGKGIFCTTTEEKILARIR